MPAPENVGELRSFLGMVNHLAKFLPRIAEKIQPLKELLHSDAAWCWDKQHETAFRDVKAELSTTPALAYYDFRAKLTLSTDAPSYGLRAVLLREDPGESSWSTTCW